MRYILLDKITEVQPGQSARGLKAVTLTDPVLHDHFPDYPILPGALLIEAAAQLAGFLLEVSLNTDETKEPKRALLVQVDKTKFYRPAGPGDVVALRAEMGSLLADAAQVKVEASVGEQRAMRGQLTFMMKTVPSERLREQRRYLYGLWTRELDLGGLRLP